MTATGCYLETTVDFATGDFTFASESAPAPLNAGDGLVTEGHLKGPVSSPPTDESGQSPDLLPVLG